MLNYLKKLTPTQRIALAIVLSLLVHALFASSTWIELPKPEFSPPPMVAKLEPLPPASKTPTEEKTPEAAASTPKPSKAKVKEQNKTPAVEPAPQPTEVVEHTPEPQPQTAEPTPTPAVEPEAAPTPTVAENTPEKQPEPQNPIAQESNAPEEQTDGPPRPLPTQVVIGFNLYDRNNIKQGEALHDIKIHHQRYVIRASMEGGPFGAVKLKEESRGTFGRTGFKSMSYSRETVRGFSKASQRVDLDWDKQNMTFAETGEQVAFPPNTQDFLSMLYQLSQLPLQNRRVQLAVTNGRGLERYILEVQGTEVLETDAGKVNTLKLSKLHAPEQEGTEIWLATEHKLLPVQVRQIAKDGSTSFELRLSGMRLDANLR